MQVAIKADWRSWSESSTTAREPHPLPLCRLAASEVKERSLLLLSWSIRFGSFQVHVEVLGSFRGRVCAVLVVGLGLGSLRLFSVAHAQE